MRAWAGAGQLGIRRRVGAGMGRLKGRAVGRLVQWCIWLWQYIAAWFDYALGLEDDR